MKISKEVLIFVLAILIFEEYVQFVFWIGTNCFGRLRRKPSLSHELIYHNIGSQPMRMDLSCHVQSSKYRNPNRLPDGWNRRRYV